MGSIFRDESKDKDNWIEDPTQLKRQFTIQSLRDSECMCLKISDLNRMKTEFRENYDKFFDDSLQRLRRALKLRLKAEEICAEKEETMS